MKVGNEKQINAHNMLNIIWGGFSILLLLLVLYFVWHSERLHTQKELIYAADEISDQVDNFIDDLASSIYALPIHSTNLKTCPPELLAKLQRVAFDNPEISGLIIKDKAQKVICSTISDKNIPIIPDNNKLILFGPIKIGAHAKPAFVMQHRLGDYLIDIYLLKTVVQNTLATTTPIAKLIALYDGHQKKFILQNEYDSDTDSWQPSAAHNYMNNNSLSEYDPLMLTMKLNNLDNFHILLIGDADKFRMLTAYHAAIAAAVVIALSYLIYFLFRQRINTYFSLNRSMAIALKNKQFYPVYQPIFNTSFGDSVGAEILLRWRDDNEEVIMPDSFIKEAEESGLILPITLLLMEKVFKECKELLQTNPNFHLALNLSSVHFTDDTFFDSFETVCKIHNISPRQLMLEITERDLLSKEDEMLIKRMNKLREAGYSLAVDDFGTGHASIGYLQHFPFDYLKIDKLFVQAIGTGAVTEALNLSIILMAKNLKMTIIAEGVETTVQLDYLQEQGVELMQGWYFSKALSIEALQEFINRSSYE